MSRALFPSTAAGSWRTCQSSANDKHFLRFQVKKNTTMKTTYVNSWWRWNASLRRTEQLKTTYVNTWWRWNVSFTGFMRVGRRESLELRRDIIVCVRSGLLPPVCGDLHGVDLCETSGRHQETSLMTFSKNPELSANYLCRRIAEGGDPSTSALSTPRSWEREAPAAP